MNASVPHTGEPRHSAAPPLRKAIYLDGTHLRSVRLEGPALKVEDDMGRLRYYPLARLSRVILRGNLQCETEVLQALLSAGLPLVIVGQEGEALGWLVSAQPILLSTLQQRLEEAEGLSLLQQMLEDWRLSRLRMMILRHVVPHLPNTHLSDLRARTMRNRANALIFRRSGLQWRKILRRLRAPLRALVLQQLQEAGLDAQWLGADADRPDMSTIFSQLLEWVLWGVALRRRQLPAFDTWRDEIAFFEAQRHRLEREAQMLITDLQRTLQDTLFHLGRNE